MKRHLTIRLPSNSKILLGIRHDKYPVINLYLLLTTKN